MVVIRLARGGTVKRPFYHVVVADRRRARGGKYIERIGLFNPIAKGGEERLRIDLGRVDHWLARGAQTSERVTDLLKQYRATAKAA
jgi:small subunit ribosomal protein S16